MSIVFLISTYIVDRQNYKKLMTRVKVSAIINVKTIEGSTYMNKKEEYQEIYINLDDSGKLTTKEKISVYAGIVFLSKQEKDKFITQYRQIINEIKCSYCDQTKGECTKKCKEIKNTNIKKGHKRRLMNYISKYYTIALIINNTKVYDHIINNKASKGRYIDYTIRRLIKSTIEELIKDKKINPHKNVRLIINIDEQSTKSNGYYNLKDGLTEELLHGISNYNYDIKYKNILYGKLEIRLTYQDSGKNYLVQAADLIAGTTRGRALSNIDSDIDIIDHKLLFP